MKVKTADFGQVPVTETTTVSGAEAIIKCLLEEGVDTVYGYPGGAIMPVYDELFKYKDKLHHILTRHEQGAAHAAQGYARVSGKVGVAIATSGPGASAKACACCSSCGPAWIFPPSHSRSSAWGPCRS